MSWADIFTLLDRIYHVIGPLLSLLVAIIGWVISKTLVTKDDLASVTKSHAVTTTKIEARLAQTEQDLHSVASDLRHLPNSDVVGELRDRVSSIETSVAGLKASVDGLRDVLERIEMPLNLLLTHELGKAKRS